MKLGIVLGVLLAAAMPAMAQETCSTIGTWNLEYFGFDASRGFPELQGADRLPARTNAQLDDVARAIRDEISAQILVLNEINGRNGQAASDELEDLTTRLGGGWKYLIAESGRRQRNAIIWNDQMFELIAHREIYIAPVSVGGFDIFERDPLVAYFRARGGGAGGGDVVVVALHLKSGTHNTENHDAAMERLKRELRALRGRNPVLPREEDDIVLAGDFNASPYDGDEEAFFQGFNHGNWKLLAEGDDYPATRISGRKLDYIFVTRKTSRQNGIFGEELTDSPAHVWVELASDNQAAFRRTYSDHFPVTSCIDLTTDND